MYKTALIVLLSFLGGFLYGQNSADISKNIDRLKNSIEEKFRIDRGNWFDMQVDVAYFPNFGFLATLGNQKLGKEYCDMQLEDFRPDNSKNDKEDKKSKNILLQNTQKNIDLDNAFFEQKVKNLLVESMGYLPLEAHQSIRIMYFDKQIDYNHLQRGTQGKLIINKQTYLELSKKDFDALRDDRDKEKLLAKIKKVSFPANSKKEDFGLKIFNNLCLEIFSTISHDYSLALWYRITSSPKMIPHWGMLSVSHLDLTKVDYEAENKPKKDFQEKAVLFQNFTENLGKEYMLHYGHTFLPQLGAEESLIWYIQFTVDGKEQALTDEHYPNLLNFIIITVKRSTIESYYNKKISFEEAMKQIKVDKY
jgi:hypothetical protein